MTEENTKDLTADEKLNLILAEFADLRQWRAGVDEWRGKVDAFMEERSRDTRPMLDRIHKELADTRVEARERFDQVDARLGRIDRKFDVITSDLMELRAAQRDVEARVSILERAGTPQ